MHGNWLARIGVVLCLISGLLTAGTANSIAESEGVELLEAVSAEASGDDAYATVAAIDSFEPAGGEAVFEPGTENEETFTYEAADAESNRLAGLTRPSPLSHPAGALVAPVATIDESAGQEAASSADGETAAEDPGASVPNAEPNDDPAAVDPTTEAPGPSADALDAADQDVISAGPTSSTTPSPCEILLGKSCDEVVAEVCSEGIVCEILQDPLSLCTEGVVCDILRDPGSLCSEGTVCEILNDPPIPECVGETCDVLQDPLGPWSVCDVENTDAECPDPDDAVDLAWEAAEVPLGTLDCTASVTGPAISDGGGLVKGRGAFSCDEAFVLYIKIKVCLHRASGGVWLKMGCRMKKLPNEEHPGPGAPGFLEKKIAEPCVKQQTVKYRIRARGMAADGFGNESESTDTAKATATLYCPGTAFETATQDLIEYLESWLD